MGLIKGIKTRYLVWMCPIRNFHNRINRKIRNFCLCWILFDDFIMNDFFCRNDDKLRCMRNFHITCYIAVNLAIPIAVCTMNMNNRNIWIASWD